MRSNMSKITPFLWVEKDALAQADFYVSVFKEASIENRAALENTPSGAVQIVTMQIMGQDLVIMAAGPQFKLTEAFSLVIDCADQAEIDYFWQALTADGGEEGNCGWLKDKYGVSWQVVPRRLGELMGDSDRVRANQATQAMLQMHKIDIAELEKAFNA